MKCIRKVIRPTFTDQKAGIGDGDTSTCGGFGRVGGSGGGVGGGLARQESDPTYLQCIQKAVIGDSDTMTQVGMGGVGGGGGGGGRGRRDKTRQDGKAIHFTFNASKAVTGDGVTSWHWGGAEWGGGEGGGEADGGSGIRGVEMRHSGKSTLPSVHQKQSLC